MRRILAPGQKAPTAGVETALKSRPGSQRRPDSRCTWPPADWESLQIVLSGGNWGEGADTVVERGYTTQTRVARSNW